MVFLPLLAQWHAVRRSSCALLLSTLLCRMPTAAPAVASVAVEFAKGARAAEIISWLARAIVGLGGYNTLTAATRLETNPTPVSTGLVGSSYTQLFNVTGAPGTTLSYTISGTVPPGLTLRIGGTNLTGSLTNQVVNGSAATITGIPTTAGTYTLNVIGWRGSGGTSDRWPGGSGPGAPVVITVSGGTFTLTLGAVDNRGGSIVASPVKATYLAGDVVTLTPQPALGYVFRGWTGAASGSTNPLLFTVSGNATVQARFLTFYEVFAEDNALPTAARGPQDDANGDGVPNAVVMALGLPPTGNGRTGLTRPRVEGTGPGQTLVVPIGRAAIPSGVTLLVETAPNANGPWTLVPSEFLAIEGEQLLVRFPTATAATQFVRVGATAP